MGKELVEKLLSTFDKMEWPRNEQADAKGLQVYGVALEKIDAAKGDTKGLVAALRTLQTADSLPFVYAGVAYLLLAASAERDGSYAPEGLEAATIWLEKAQELAPDVLEINMIEALVYLYNGRFEDARTILDYLQEQEPGNFYLQTAEINYWRTQQDVDETLHAFEQAMRLAPTHLQRIQLRHQQGDFYAENGMPDKALTSYKEVVQVEKENATLWHKMSVLFFKQGSLPEAAKCNQRALHLQPDYPAARQVEAAIKSKSGK